MSNATVLPDLALFQWQTKTAPNPRLLNPINDTVTTLKFTSAPLDSAGAVITKAFLMGVRNTDSYVETIYVPAGALSDDGLTATNVVRGIELSGTDFSVGDSNNAASHGQDSPVFCNVNAVYHLIVKGVLNGTIASGGSNFIIGTDASGTTTVSRSTGTGTYVGMFRWYTTNSKAQYSNDGTTWVSLDDSIASVLLKISATDTTAAYPLTKFVAGANMTLTQNNIGGNETLTFASSSPNEGITTHTIYTPAYLTGGASAEATFSNWLAVLDGSFRLTVDGTTLNVTGINFTGVTSMADVASTIQTALRAATSGSETVVWSTDHFVITSGDTTSSSAVSVLTTSTASVGTDISGAGASNWMDADTGNGVATAAVLNKAANVGKVGFLDSGGEFDLGLMPDVLGGGITQIADSAHRHQSFITERTAGETLTVSGNPLPVYVSDGTGGRTSGRIYRSDANDSTNEARSFFGFVTSTIASGSSGSVKNGIVSGFTVLTTGAYYYVSDAVGTISATPGSAEICVGRAISTTEINTYDKPAGMQFISSVNASGVATGSTITAPAIARIAIIQVTTPATSANKEEKGQIYLDKIGQTSATFQGVGGINVEVLVSASWSGTTITLTSSTDGVGADMAATAVGYFYR